MAIDPQTCTLREAAAILGISERTAYRLNASGQFPVPVLTIGGSRRVSRRQLEAFIEGPGDQAAAS